MNHSFDNEQDTNNEKAYQLPPLSLLSENTEVVEDNDDFVAKATGQKIQEIYKNFGVDVIVSDYYCGARVNRYEVRPGTGVRIKDITALKYDLMLHLGTPDLRMDIPKPGNPISVGIEIPNKKSRWVYLNSILRSDEFQNNKFKLPIVIGKGFNDKVVIHDLAKMPHLIVSGYTGSGKSSLIDSFIMSLIFKTTPEDVKLMLIDPKIVDLSRYNGIPNLLLPVITDIEKGIGALNWAVNEMESRFNIFAQNGAKDIDGYNDKMSHIVIIINELADYMRLYPYITEEYIVRLAQLARPCGIHLIITTQTPTSNVLTGLIKANIPSRIALYVGVADDSRLIIDEPGAEKLMGLGDMLYFPSDYSSPVRIQGAFMPEDESEAVLDYIKSNNTCNVSEMEKIESEVGSLSNQIFIKNFNLARKRYIMS